MRWDGKNFRLEAVLEAPVWLLALIFTLVTIAVIASGIGVL